MIVGVCMCVVVPEWVCACDYVYVCVSVQVVPINHQAGSENDSFFLKCKMSKALFKT